MVRKKPLKLIAGIAGCACVLALVSACGQGSTPKNSSTPVQSQSALQTSGNSGISNQNDNSSTSIKKVTSGGSPSSNSTPSNVSTDSTSQKETSTPSAAQTKVNTEEPSDDILYLLSYIQLKGGLKNVNEGNVIMTGNEIGENVWVESLTITTPSFLGKSVENGMVNWTWDAQEPTKGSFATASLVNQYYSNSNEREQINSLLASAKHNGVIAVLAMLKKYDDYGSTPGQIMKTWINGSIVGNIFSFNGADSTTRIFIDGNQVKCYNCTVSQCNITTYNVNSLMNEYYGTPQERSTVNQWLANNQQVFYTP